MSKTKWEIDMEKQNIYQNEQRAIMNPLLTKAWEYVDKLQQHNNLTEAQILAKKAVADLNNIANQFITAFNTKFLSMLSTITDDQIITRSVSLKTHEDIFSINILGQSKWYQEAIKKMPNLFRDYQDIRDIIMWPFESTATNILRAQTTAEVCKLKKFFLKNLASEAYAGRHFDFTFNGFDAQGDSAGYFLVIFTINCKEPVLTSVEKMRNAIIDSNLVMFSERPILTPADSDEKKPQENEKPKEEESKTPPLNEMDSYKNSSSSSSIEAAKPSFTFHMPPQGQPREESQEESEEENESKTPYKGDVVSRKVKAITQEEIERLVQLRLDEGMAAQTREIALLKANLVEKDPQILRLNEIINNQQAENELPVSQPHDMIGQIPLENENHQRVSLSGSDSENDLGENNFEGEGH